MSRRSSREPSSRAKRRRISPERKGLYYGGMLCIAAGIVVFVTCFFSGPEVGGGDRPKPGDPDFWNRAQERHDEFKRDMDSNMVRAFIGMGLVVLGGFMMRIGYSGPAGAGLVLDPEQARRDIEPWSRMKGGAIDDALDEVGLAKRIEGKLDERMAGAEPIVKVRCTSCKTLNDEVNKFCGQCGAAM